MESRMKELVDKIKKEWNVNIDAKKIYALESKKVFVVKCEHFDMLFDIDTLNFVCIKGR